MSANNSGEYIGKYLSIARRAHASLLDEKLQPYDISHGQILLLMTIYQREGLNQHQLCSIYNLDKAGVNRSINRLVRAGYVVKKPDEEDRRKKGLYLTKKALEFKPRLVEILAQVESQVRKNLSQEEIDVFLKIIRKITSNLGVKL